MRRCKYELETARYAGQIFACLFGNMSAVIVQDHPYGCLLGIVTVQSPEMIDELSAAVPVRHHPVNMPVE